MPVIQRDYVLQNPTSTGAPSPTNRRRWTWLVLVVLPVSILLLLLVRGRSNEPAYGGKTLTEWLLNTNAGWVWIPNDLYGHIHDELWERLVGQDSETNALGPTFWQPVAAPDARTLAVRQIGTNGIPTLIELMSSRPTPWAKMRGAIAELFPARIGEFLYPYHSRNFPERKNSAACDGFAILGTNAEPALPAMSNLLFQGTEHMQLTSAISSIGSKGMAVLTNALVRTRAHSFNTAALALGWQYENGKSAVPALLNCVEEGYASYQILGALGRIGCDDPRLVSALIRLLEQRSSQTNTNLNEEMAFLLLGLQREKARPAAPLVIAGYQLVADDPNAPAARRFYRRILKSIAPDLVAQLPPPCGPDEESADWP